jgi:hypothetical protein
VQWFPQRRVNQLIWAVLGAASALSPIYSSVDYVGDFGLEFAIFMLVFPVIFFPLGAMILRTPPAYYAVVAKHVDKYFGEGAFANYLVDLKPLLLFSVMALGQALVGLLVALSQHAPQDVFIFWGLFVSGGLGMGLAHLISYKNRDIGIYPLKPHEVQAKQPNGPSLPVSGQIKAYWPYLIGIAVFPAIFFVGSSVWGLSFEYFMLPFFVVAIVAGWPVVRGKAGMTFFVVASFLYVTSAIVTVAVLAFLN